jgi:7-cyano-7-deazaguanine synthase in queuosine biosynthesis
MSETLIVCGGEPAPLRCSGAVFELDVSPTSPPDKRIRFNPGIISAQLVDDLPDALADAVEMAAYVFSADRLARRGSKDSRHIGAEWQRHLRFRIPVRRHDLWNRKDIKDSLGSALAFLSGDQIEFEFTKARDPWSIEPHLGFSDSGAQVIRPDKVILFSGGLDSLAGIAEHVAGHGGSAILVAHQSATQVANYQNRLADKIAMRSAPKQTFYAPIWVRRGESNPTEHSQRLRSFLFASLGIAYARMFGRNSVYFHENGITSFNLPVAEQVVGTRASRTTHPSVLRRFGDLFSLLLDESVTFENPFLWKTKGDVLAAIHQHGWSDLIGSTTSCAKIRDFSMTGLHCGACSQCVERRFGVLAAGLAAYEPETAYLTDLFVGAHEDGRDLAMIEAHVLRAQKLSTMSEYAFVANYGQVFRALPDVEGKPEEAAHRIYHLHRRYGASLMQVLDQQLARHSRLTDILQLPSSSLLGMLRTPVARHSVFLDPIELEPRPSVEAEGTMSVVPKRRIAFAVTDSGRVALQDCPTLPGNVAALMARLAEQFISDLESGTDKRDYAYVPTKKLMAFFNTSDDLLRQRVRRARRFLEKKFEAATGYTLDEHDIIQSTRWTGYRLNPYLILMDARAVSETPSVSRKISKSVTTPEQRP